MTTLAACTALDGTLQGDHTVLKLSTGGGRTMIYMYLLFRAKKKGTPVKAIVFCDAVRCRGIKYDLDRLGIKVLRLDADSNGQSMTRNDSLRRLCIEHFEKAEVLVVAFSMMLAPETETYGPQVAGSPRSHLGRHWWRDVSQPCRLCEILKVLQSGLSNLQWNTLMELELPCTGKDVAHGAGWMRLAEAEAGAKKLPELSPGVAARLLCFLDSEKVLLEGRVASLYMELLSDCTTSRSSTCNPMIEGFGCTGQPLNFIFCDEVPVSSQVTEKIMQLADVQETPRKVMYEYAKLSTKLDHQKLPMGITVLVATATRHTHKHIWCRRTVLEQGGHIVKPNDGPDECLRDFRSNWTCQPASVREALSLMVRVVGLTRAPRKGVVWPQQIGMSAMMEFATPCFGEPDVALSLSAEINKWVDNCVLLGASPVVMQEYKTRLHMVLDEMTSHLDSDVESWLTIRYMERNISDELAKGGTQFAKLERAMLELRKAVGMWGTRFDRLMLCRVQVQMADLGLGLNDTYMAPRGASPLAAIRDCWTPNWLRQVVYELDQNRTVLAAGNLQMWTGLLGQRLPVPALSSINHALRRYPLARFDCAGLEYIMSCTVSGLLSQVLCTADIMSIVCAKLLYECDTVQPHINVIELQGQNKELNKSLEKHLTTASVYPRIILLPEAMQRGVDCANLMATRLLLDQDLSAAGTLEWASQVNRLGNVTGTAHVVMLRSHGRVTVKPHWTDGLDFHGLASNDVLHHLFPSCMNHCRVSLLGNTNQGARDLADNCRLVQINDEVLRERRSKMPIGWRRRQTVPKLLEWVMQYEEWLLEAPSRDSRESLKARLALCSTPASKPRDFQRKPLDQGMLQWGVHAYLPRGKRQHHELDTQKLTLVALLRRAREHYNPVIAQITGLQNAPRSMTSLMSV